MTVKVAINGYGRIGRTVLRAIFENSLSNIEVVAINASGDAACNLHLTKYDTVHGKFNFEVELANNKKSLVIDGKEIRLFSERDASKLPWGDLAVDVVLECTGAYSTRERASIHLASGAKKVLLSSPAKGEVDATVVYGVNHNIISKEHKIISNSSCTTNCLAPLAAVLHKEFTIESGLVTTVHAFTNDQVLTDVHHKDLRRARSATNSIIPTKTGAATSIGLIIPELSGKLDGFSLRVPTINVSALDFNFTTKQDVSAEMVNACIKDAANGTFKSILEYTDEPLVSTDFNHNSSSAILDASCTKAVDNMVKVMAWYDNEWGYANRMLDIALVMHNAGY